MCEQQEMAAAVALNVLHGHILQADAGLKIVLER